MFNSCMKGYFSLLWEKRPKFDFHNSVHVSKNEKLGSSLDISMGKIEKWIIKDVKNRLNSAVIEPILKKVDLRIVKGVENLRPEI